MANRKGVFIGAYVPAELKRALQQRATSEHRTLSQEITRILEEAVKGPRLPPNFVERRAPGQLPRRRDTDPLPRRRRDDLPYKGPQGGGRDEEVTAEVYGKARRHFGAWNSGDERSADNERIDRDLAREYDNSR